MKKFIPFFILIFVIGFVVAISSCCINCPNPSAEGKPADANSEPMSRADPPPELSGRLVAGVRVIEMTARKFKFEPDVITVQQGDKIRLEITSKDVRHGFALKDFKIDRVIEPGKTEIIEFTADTSGKFNFRCSVFCGMGHLGMKGRLIILP